MYFSKHKKWMRFLYAIFFIQIFLIGTSIAAKTAQPEDDFKYYKKYGKTSKDWNDFVKNGFEAYDGQDCEKALAFLKQAITAGSKDPLAYYKLAACSELSGNYDAAVGYYAEAESALAILPSPHPYTNTFNESYGRALYLNRKPDQAFTYLKKAVDSGNHSFFLYYLLGRIALEKGNEADTLVYFQKAITQAADGASPAQLSQVYQTLGEAALNAKEPTKALDYFQKALKQTPDDPELKKLEYKASELKRQEEIFKIKTPKSL